MLVVRVAMGRTSYKGKPRRDGMGWDGTGLHFLIANFVVGLRRHATTAFSDLSPAIAFNFHDETLRMLHNEGRRWSGRTPKRNDRKLETNY